MLRDDALARLAGADWLPVTQPFFDCLGGASGQTRVVGGIVRDTLLGRPRETADIDMATELIPDEVASRASAAGLAVHPTGLDHGTVTLVHEGQAVEVTTLRRDVETFGRHAKVAFGTNWTEDARRRDFTMNALYCGPDGSLFDPLSGLDDCLAGRVRFIGDPDARIAEDRLRVYRYFRFTASHGGERFEADALAACARAAGELSALSAERVGREMMRLMGQPHCAATITAMVEAGVLPATQFPPQVVEALKRQEELPVRPVAEMRLALVALSDVSVTGLRTSWRLSNASMKRITGLVDAARLAHAARWAELRYRHPEIAAQAIAVAGAFHGSGESWVVEGLREVGTHRPGRFPLSGRDLLAAGIAFGPGVGAELKRLETLWIESGFKLDRDALLARARGDTRQ